MKFFGELVWVWDEAEKYISENFHLDEQNIKRLKTVVEQCKSYNNLIKGKEYEFGFEALSSQFQ